MENNKTVNTTMTEVAKLLTEMVVDNDLYDVKQVVNNNQFRKTGLVISMAKGWGGVPSNIVDYCLKYGEDTVNYTMRQIMRMYDEKAEKEQQEDSEAEEQAE